MSLRESSKGITDENLGLLGVWRSDETCEPNLREDQHQACECYLRKM